MKSIELKLAEQVKNQAKLLLLYLSLSLCLGALLMACGDDQHRRLQNMYDWVVVENKDLKKQLAELQAKNSELERKLASVERTDNYYYQIAVTSRQDGKYEKSNVQVSELLTRFPNTRLRKEATLLVSNNNRDLANQLYNKAVGLQNSKNYQQSTGICNDIMARFPMTSFATKAKKLKSENVAKIEAQQIANARRGYDLELLDWNWRIEDRYAYAEGQVKNISSKNLQNVQAVVSFYDANNGFIKSENALIKYNPILPGQMSPFKVMATGNPAMNKAELQFKFMFGASISTYVQKK